MPRAKKGGAARPEQEPEQAKAPRLRLDDSDMRSSYANVCHVASSREEVALLFGTNQSLQPRDGEIRVRVDNRVVLSPAAALRLASLLQHVVGEYERRFGPIARPGAPAPEAEAAQG